MAHPQQARYGPPANYYDAPRSAPLEPPQEYAQEYYDYGQQVQQQPYAYDDGYQSGIYDGRQGQHRGQQPPRQAPRQFNPPPQNMGRGGPPSRHDGRYGDHGDKHAVNRAWNQPPQDPYYQQNAPGDYERDQRYIQGGDYRHQASVQGHKGTAYEQQGLGQNNNQPYDQSYEQPRHGRQQLPQPRPAPQRSFSAGPEQNAQDARSNQSRGQASAPNQQGTARAPPQINLASAPRKKEKKRILQEPESPETLPWDNPFPIFPGMQEKKQSAKGDTSRPQTAASNRRSHESSRSVDGQLSAVNHPQTERGGPKRHLAVQTSPHPVQQNQNNIPHQDPVPQPRPSGDRSRPRPRPFDDHSGLQPIMAPPQPAFTGGEQRSNTLPSDISEAIIQGNFPIRSHEQSQRSVAEAQRRDPPQQFQNRPPQHPDPPQQRHQRSNSFDTGSAYSQSTVQLPPKQPGRSEHQGLPNEYSRKPSASSQRSKTPQQGLHDQNQYAPQQVAPKSNASNGYKQAFARSQPTIHEAPHVSEGSHVDVVDDYFEESELSNFKPYRSPPTAAAPAGDDEEDMPDFDNALSSPTHDKALHLEPHKSNNSSPRLEDDSRGRSSGRGPTRDFAGQAHRSRSQPNLRGQESPNDLTGFDFGISNGHPDMPPMNPRFAKQSPNPSSHKSPPNPEFRGQWQQPNNGPFGPPGRSHTEGFGPEPGPGPGPAFRHNVGPRPPMGGSGMQTGPRPGPGQGPRPGPRHSPGPGVMSPPPPGSGPRPQNSSRAVSEGSHRQGPRQTPPNSSSANSDALPQHPAPTRAGHTHQAQSPPMNQQNPSRPPPVRQYNGSSPVAQANIAPPPPQATSAPVTYEELQQLRGVVQSRPNDQATQLVLARKLVEAASILADEGGRADPKTKAKNRERYITDAHKMIKKLVGLGNTEAMFYLADCFGSGQLGLQKDSKEAFQLYQSAAKLNHAQSAYRVAVCCEIGLDEGGGTRRDPVKAIQWYQRAAQLGDVPAMYKLGVIQLKGLLGQSRNPREAMTWLQKAAERADVENPHALHELALLYQNAGPSDGVPRDEAATRQLFQQAADLGYKFSQFKLGQAYEQGQLGFPQNPRLSIMWYSKAAMQEEHQSELGLSGWYLTGAEGVLPQNDTEAYLWARKAAQAGLAKAEYAMGYFTEVGIGSPADLEAAKRWYWKSASQNFPKARERLEDLRRGGTRIQKTRVSRSALNKPEGECKVM